MWRVQKEQALNEVVSVYVYYQHYSFEGKAFFNSAPTPGTRVKRCE
jgi:hypothetical protein